MTEILHFKKGAIIIKLNATVTDIMSGEIQCATVGQIRTWKRTI
jgi:hypothetical protein